jgi:lysozyme
MEAAAALDRKPVTSLDASAECIAIVKAFEAFSATWYVCPGGKPTIGYGHVILLHEQQFRERPISEREAEQLLAADLMVAQRGVWALAKVPLAQREYDALTSLVFNVGAGKADGVKGDFADSTLLELLNRGDYELAAVQFDRWVYSRGKRLAGLVRRRAAERAMFEGRDWRAML